MLAVKCDNVLMGVPWESFFFFSPWDLQLLW